MEQNIFLLNKICYTLLPKKKQSLKQKFMKNPKELTVRQIKTMFKESSLLSGEIFKLTTKEILLSLENEYEKDLIYKLFEAYKTMKKLKVQIKMQEIKNSKNTVQ